MEKSFVKFNKEFLKTDEFNTKIPTVMSYLKINSSLSGKVGTSINMIVKLSGYSPNHRDGRINSKFIEALDWLRDNNHISLSTDIHSNNLKVNDCFIVKINNESSLFDGGKYFVKFQEDEFDKIAMAKTKHNKQSLISVFLNIKQYINLDDITPKICYPSHRTLQSACKCSIGAINNIVKDLVDIGLLYTYNSGMYTDRDGISKYANNCYALEKEALIPEYCDNVTKNYLSEYGGITVDKFIKGKQNI